MLFLPFTMSLVPTVTLLQTLLERQRGAQTDVKKRRKVDHLQVLPPCVSDRDDIPGEREPQCKHHSEQFSS